jgi:hypothetical protein
MLWPRNGLGLPMISPVIEPEVRRSFSPNTVAEPGVPGLEFGVFEFVWDLGFERCQFPWDGCVFPFRISDLFRLSNLKPPHRVT